MAAPAAKPAAPLVLAFGEDDFAVHRRARQLYDRWSQELGGMDHEIIDATASNAGEALRALAKLREALQTLPFFGSGKAIWFRGCNFLSEERPASAAVTEVLAEIAQELKSFNWQGVRLLISAGKVDKRKVFYKALDKLGQVESFEAWSANDRDWAAVAADAARASLTAREKSATDETIDMLVEFVGPHQRQLESEIEKISLYAGNRATITKEDVAASVARNKTARAFALGDALGERNLPEVLRRLNEELWELKFDKKKNEIALLYGIISKVRAMILLKEMIREGWIRETPEYNRFKAQLEQVPAEKVPADKRFNPKSINAYVLFKALTHVRNYSAEDLVRAMELLLRCNQKLVSSGLDERLALQQTLVEIVGAE